MTRLERQQRGLLDLIKKRGAPSDDAYLQQLTGSRELAMVREIALWWRRFQLEDQCPFTSRLLKRLGAFEAMVATYFSQNATFPFVEELSRDFLSWLRNDRNQLIQAVSQFERALMEVRAGSAETFEVLWDRHPDLVLRALDQGSELPAPEQECLYRMRIDRDLPHMIACTREFSSQPS
jgi:hypothetical protein